MKNKRGIQLIEGSKYRVLSVGAKDTLMETEGVFRGYATLGIDEVGICIERQRGRKKNIRIIPLHAILAIDVLAEAKKNLEAESKETEHYYG